MQFDLSIQVGMYGGSSGESATPLNFILRITTSASLLLLLVIDRVIFIIFQKRRQLLPSWGSLYFDDDDACLSFFYLSRERQGQGRQVVLIQL